MTLTETIDAAIVDALAELGRPATEHEIERHPAVLTAARRAKLRARARVRHLTKTGRVRWDYASQAPRFWIDRK